MKRQEYLEKLHAEHRMMGFKNLIYIDETGFDAHCYRDSGWVQKGQSILGLVSGKRKRRTNLMMAQRHGRKGQKKEWLAPMIFEGSCTAVLVETWIKDHLMKELHEPTIIVMDNASFHNHKRIQDIVAPAYHMVIPLPPYSPDFNPIEKTFGAMKKRRKSLPPNTTIDQLILSYY
jgi:transposase